MSRCIGRVKGGQGGYQQVEASCVSGLGARFSIRPTEC